MSLYEGRTLELETTIDLALRRALSLGDGTVRRLRTARAAVTFRCDDRQVTLDLRGDTPALARDEGDIVLDLPREALEAFVAGRLNLPLAVAAGDVAYAGPVRQYLRVDPILRRLLTPAGSEGGPQGVGRHEQHPVSPLPESHQLDPEVLSIQTLGLHKSFGPNHVLRGLDLAIPEGVLTVVLGPSGTGKSVLLDHVIGLQKPDAGDVVIRGRRLSSMSRDELLLLRREIGVMFQDGALYSFMNVYDNVAFPLRQHTNLTEAEIAVIVREHLASVGLLDAAQRMPNALSGGMRKRAGLARGLVLGPGIVLCDEPDSGLDPVRTALLGELLIEQHAEYGGTMLVVTHNVMLARLIADHVSVVWRGEVLESGSAQQMFASETPFVRQFLAGASDGPLGMDA